MSLPGVDVWIPSRLIRELAEAFRRGDRRRILELAEVVESYGGPRARLAVWALLRRAAVLGWETVAGELERLASEAAEAEEAAGVQLEPRVFVKCDERGCRLYRVERRGERGVVVVELGPVELGVEEG